jgi:parvulin-like peptidyl-prolyl isomerase
MLVLLAGAWSQAGVADQVLASVGTLRVTATDLNSAMASAPFAGRFPSMAEDDQAGLRGDMLRRLVVSRLLTLEAQHLGLDKKPAFRKDVDDFRLGLLYRAYMERLRRSIVISEQTLAAMKRQFKNDRDGLDAARAAYVGERYRAAKGAALQALLKADHLRLREERIAGAVPNTVLAAGSTLRVRYGDLLDAAELARPPRRAEIIDRLQRRVELVAAAKAAADRGVDVDTAVNTYRRQRLPAALMEVKTKEWIPGEKTLRDWYDAHPKAATIPERRHIGQLVVATRKQADALRTRIAKGESLFVLAGKYSVEPVSRKRNGDVGWVIEGRGEPALEQALAKLKDGETSPVIETRDGKFHILTVLEHVGGRKESYAGMRDHIAQAIINERLPAYVGELEKRYPVTWNVLAKPGERTAAK